MLSYGRAAPPGSRSTCVVCWNAGLLNLRSTLEVRLWRPGRPAGRLSTFWDCSLPGEPEPCNETLDDEIEEEAKPRSPASTVEVVACPLYNESLPPPPGADFFDSGEGLKAN